MKNSFTLLPRFPEEIFIYPLCIVLNMSKHPVSDKQTLRYNGLFDMDGLYAAVVDWAKTYGFMWLEGSYKHKVPSPRGAKQELEWMLTKNITNYLQHEIKFTIVSWDTTEMEVIVDGKKKMLTNARIDIVIKGFMTYDWQELFKGSNFIEKLGDWYRNIIFKKELEGIYNDQCHYRQLDLHAIIKKYFDMQAKKYAYKGYLGEQ